MVKSTKSEKFTLLSNSPAVMMISCNLSNPTSEKIGFVHHALIERYLATTLINTSNSTSVKMVEFLLQFLHQLHFEQIVDLYIRPL